MRHHDKLFGLFLTVFGLFFLVDSLDILSDFSHLIWPVILLLISAALHLIFFLGDRSRDRAGILVPAGVLLVLGLLYLCETSTGWQYAGTTWPVYLLSAAFGLFERWVFGGREKKLLIPVLILSAISLIFIANSFFDDTAGFIWPGLAIGFGIYYLLRSPKQKE
ncbi:hypothetical protein GKZ89_07105 [Bacillus mangrovi]|uniref:LiaI-LiaF-like transmembrane region domain-containing protein n=1 Tax=Metabacillus mangrovi TaxID=1491830 RepID=A0A7X2S3S5_9BACI|nr:DUF5668 domain-containing protein [Metabacillus mangrovi]MTH53178.1 hypothetical protein [Metabacillus mangrovi]